MVQSCVPQGRHPDRRKTSVLKAPDALPSTMKAVFEGCVAGSVNYKPHYYPGKVTYLMCGYHGYMPEGPRAVWGRLVRSSRYSLAQL